jgi:hypothetical protein
VLEEGVRILETLVSEKITRFWRGKRKNVAGEEGVRGRRSVRSLPTREGKMHVKVCDQRKGRERHTVRHYVLNKDEGEIVGIIEGPGQLVRGINQGRLEKEKRGECQRVWKRRGRAG